MQTLPVTFAALSGPVQPGALLDQQFAAVLSGYGQGVAATIAALRANTASGFGVVELLGYRALNDGGGGAFLLDASDHTTADDGGAVIVDAAGQRWKRQIPLGAVTPKMFGAVADGATNDTTAMQAAINYAAALASARGCGAVVDLGPYNYAVGQITPASFVTLRGTMAGGEGYQNSSSRLTPAYLTAGQYLINQAAAITAFVLKGVMALGQGGASDIGGVNLPNATACVIDSCYFGAWGREAIVIGGGNNRLTETFGQGLFNAAYLTQQRGTLTISGGDHQVKGCEWAGPSQNAVSSANLYAAACLDATFDALFEATVFETGDWGHYRAGGSRARIVGCRFDTNAGHGSGGGSSGDAVFSGCFWSRNSYSADNAYDHIHIDPGGPARDTYVAPQFRNNGHVVRYCVYDHKTSSQFHNVYVTPQGDSGGSAFYNFSGNQEILFTEGGNAGAISGATPSVLNRTRFVFGNATNTTVTNFTGGVDGQVIVLFGGGAGTTTLQNNSNIRTKAGADLVLGSLPVSFGLLFGVWQQL